MVARGRRSGRGPGRARARATTVVRAGGPIQRVRDEGAGEGVERVLAGEGDDAGIVRGDRLAEGDARGGGGEASARARVVDGNLARVSIELAEAARRRRRDVRGVRAGSGAPLVIGLRE